METIRLHKHVKILKFWNIFCVNFYVQNKSGRKVLFSLNVFQPFVSH